MLVILMNIKNRRKSSSMFHRSTAKRGGRAIPLLRAKPWPIPLASRCANQKRHTVEVKIFGPSGENATVQLSGVNFTLLNAGSCFIQLVKC